MPPDYWSHLIAASVVPVVVISAAALMCLAFYNRLAAIVSRLRGFQRERLQQRELLSKAHLQKDNGAVVYHERMIDLLDEQTADVTKRGRLIRATLMFLLAAIGTLIICSLLCGATAVIPGAIFWAVPMFGFGLVLLFAGVTCAFLEMRGSLAPVELESEVIALLVP